MATREGLIQLQELKAFAKNRIAKGSLSFHLASLLLPGKTRAYIHLLYAWCRYIDDRTDELPKDADIETKTWLINDIRQETISALSKEPTQNYHLLGLEKVVSTFNIPKEYVIELVNGMAMDLQSHEYNTFEDLKLYCYRVAGVVGLMTTHIFGIDDEKALESAEGLGIAMQLTNIARDLKEDEENGRCYIPKAVLKDLKITSSHFDDHQRYIIAKFLLAKAERFYQSGDRGIKHLPMRVAFAVSAARHIYAAIGHKVLKRKEEAWQTRTWISTPHKILLILRSLKTVFSTIPYRLRTLHKTPITITTIRRPG